MRQALINFFKAIGIDDTVRWWYIRAIIVYWHVFGFLSNRNARFFKNYKSKNDVHKVHLGCGLNYLDGWLNTDIKPHQNRISLDISKRFFFPDNSFDCAYSEHVIEHIPYVDGKNMLQECFRILKPGGTLRLATPDFLFLLGLYNDDSSELHKRYIDWNCDEFIKDSAPHSALSVVNNYVRDWGHVYIYDFPTFEKALSEYGFEDIKKVELGKSANTELQDLENESRHPEGFLALESLIIEAKKPL